MASPSDDGPVSPVDLAVLLVLALVLGAAVLLARARARRPAGSATHDLDEALLDADERRMLDAALAEVEREHAGPVRRLLASRVVVLRNRQVPLRAVRPAGEPPVARLCFANGTVLRARPTQAGEWAPLVIAVVGRGHSVVIESYEVGESEVVIVLVGPGGVRQRVTVVGLDQPA